MLPAVNTTMFDGGVHPAVAAWQQGSLGERRGGVTPRQSARPRTSPSLSRPSRALPRTGIGLSGSGFLLFYFVGALASLTEAGVVGPRTVYAGSSGGALTAVAAGCGGLAPPALLDELIATSEGCRHERGCFVSGGLLHAAHAWGTARWGMHCVHC
jgi:hypothetical protein